MISTFASGTQTAVINTEHFLSSPNVQGTFQSVIDLVNMAAGDVTELRVYQMAIAGGTQRVAALQTFYGVQPTDNLIALSTLIRNAVTTANAVRFSLKQTFGTGRNYAWAVEKDDALTPATSGQTLVVDAAGLADANVVKLGPTGAGTAQTARDIGASVLLSSGSGAGQLDFTSGVAKANLAQILGTALTETAGQLAAAFKKFFNIAAPAATMDHGILVDTVTAVTNRVSITSGIIKNTALANFEFLMTDSTTHSPVTGKAVTVTRSVNNGAFAAGTLSAVTEIAFGIYSVDWGAGDLNGTVITLRATAAGSDDLFITIVPDP